MLKTVPSGDACPMASRTAPERRPGAATIVWLMMIAGIAVFGETPDRWTIIGSAVIILAGIAALRLSRQPARAQAA